MRDMSVKVTEYLVSMERELRTLERGMKDVAASVVHIKHLAEALDKEVGKKVCDKCGQSNQDFGSYILVPERLFDEARSWVAKAQDATYECMQVINPPDVCNLAKIDSLIRRLQLQQ